MVLSARNLAFLVISLTSEAGRGTAAQSTPPAPPPPSAPVSTTPAAKGDGAKSTDLFDEKADARTEVKTALANAKRENRRVLVEWGANWCGWCRKLHGLFNSNPELAKKLLYEYDVVYVDIGQRDKNMDLAKELGADFQGVPYLTILDANGEALAQQPTDPFEVNTADVHGHDPKKLLDFLTLWQADYPKAADLMTDALAQAKSSGKRVFVHYGAPWCPYCRLLDRWMANPEVAALLAKDFVDLKIDVDRTVGGKEAFVVELRRAEPKVDAPENYGIPWIVLLDGDGKQLAVGHTENGNVGCPATEEEIAHFVAMLGKARVHLTDADVAALRDSLLKHTESVRARAANAGH
jgi:thiol-disulfide isomerase/thioredoxin